MSDYVKLSSLVDGTFTVQKVFGYKFKMWDNATKKMLISEKWEKDYRKMYTIDTDRGTLDVSASQMGNMLEAVTKDGRADINGRAFSVKSNGKTGMDIRYYINAVKESTAGPTNVIEGHKPVTADDIYALDSIGF